MLLFFCFLFLFLHSGENVTRPEMVSSTYSQDVQTKGWGGGGEEAVIEFCYDDHVYVLYVYKGFHGERVSILFMLTLTQEWTNASNSPETNIFRCSSKDKETKATYHHLSFST